MAQSCHHHIPVFAVLHFIGASKQCMKEFTVMHVRTSPSHCFATQTNQDVVLLFAFSDSDFHFQAVALLTPARQLQSN